MRRTGKVIQMDNEANDVTIFFDESNQSAHHSLNDFNYTPAIGDMVEILPDGDNVIVSQYVAPKGFNLDAITGETGQKKVNKLVYILLAVLLGNLGIHKFYAGKNKMGIVYLLFCWTLIPGIVGLIEGILAISKQADANGDMYI